MRSQGWTPFVLDTNGNGRRDAYVEPDQPADPAKDTRVAVNIYAVAISPADGIRLGHRPRLPRRHRPRRARRESHRDRADGDLRAARARLRPARRRRRSQRRVLGVAGERTSRQLRPPQVQGAQRSESHRRALPEGWTFHQLPGPQLRDVQEPGSAEASYYTWVDWFDTFGLGTNVPIAMGNLNSSILPLVNGRSSTSSSPIRWASSRRTSTAASTIRMPAGRARALWSTYGTRTMFHLEGGTANRPKAVKIQLRPDPLAR